MILFETRANLSTNHNFFLQVFSRAWRRSQEIYVEFWSIAFMSAVIGRAESRSGFSDFGSTTLKSDRLEQVCQNLDPISFAI